MKQANVKEGVREAIIEAARVLMERYGYRKMTVDDIALEAGIGKGSVYLHFESKEEVALCAIDALNEQLQARLTEIAQSSLTSEIRLRKMLEERVFFRFDTLQNYRCGLDETLAMLRSKLLARRESYYRMEAAIFAEVIQEGQRLGSLKPGDAGRLGFSLVHATNGFMPFSLSPRELGRRDEIAERLSHVIDLLLCGLLSYEVRYEIHPENCR